MRSFSLLQTSINFIQNDLALNLKEIHIVNASTVAQKIYLVIKPVLKKELRDQVNFHSSIDALVRLFGRERLPEEYGGLLGKIDYLHNKEMDKLGKHADVLKDFEFE